MTYDLDGNLTSDGRWDYFWDAENRLIEVKATSAAFSAGFPLDRMTYTYDVSGRRIQRRRQQWSTPQQTWLLLEESRHLYDGWQCIADLNGSLTIQYSYAWGTDLSGNRTGAGGVGGLLWVWKHASPDAGRYFAAYDGNGNVTALYSETGAIVGRYEYGPFGEALRVTATHSVGGANPWRWSTKRTDPTTDLVHYEYRVYDPSAGRWLSRDPIEERGGVNVYGFSNNRPVNSIDRYGLSPIVISAITKCTAQAITQWAMDNMKEWAESVSICKALKEDLRNKMPWSSTHTMEYTPRYSEENFAMGMFSCLLKASVGFAASTVSDRTLGGLLEKLGSEGVDSVVKTTNTKYKMEIFTLCRNGRLKYAIVEEVEIVIPGQASIVVRNARRYEPDVCPGMCAWCE